MTQHPHSHDHHHHAKSKGPHKDWRMWAVVILAIAIILMYVMSDDESIQPEGPGAGEVSNPPVEAAP